MNKEEQLELLRQECKSKLKELSEEFIEKEIIKKALFYDDDNTIYFILHIPINLSKNILKSNIIHYYYCGLDNNLDTIMILDTMLTMGRFYYQKGHLILSQIPKDTLLELLLPWNYKELPNGFSILNKEESELITKKLLKEREENSLDYNVVDK